MTAEPSVRFAGFPARPLSTPIPNVFFTDVLPRITEPTALGVVLYAFNFLARKKGFPRYVTHDDLAADPALGAFLANCGADLDTLGPGLARAAEIGVLLRLTVERDGERRDLYFLNAPADRRGLESVSSGVVPVGRVVPTPAPAAQRPGVYALYESTIGAISPLVAAELAEAERLYPAEWLEAAFREAAALNKRSWRYVSRILERWAIEGPDHAKTHGDPAARDRYFAGKYGRVLKQRLDR